MGTFLSVFSSPMSNPSHILTQNTDRSAPQERLGVKMIDVSGKAVTRRTAVASGRIRMAAATRAAIQSGKIAKGDALTSAQVAGILGAKKTPDLIPMCHPLALSGVNIRFDLPASGDSDGADVVITAEVTATGQTGVEMEAITAVAVAAITLYDMCKGIDDAMVIGPITLLSKTGGRSGNIGPATPDLAEGL